MKKIIFSLAVVLMPFLTWAQLSTFDKPHISKYNQYLYIDTIPVNPWAIWGGYKVAMVYFPPAYFTNPTQKFPSIVFCHGRGEAGTDISKMLVNGPLHFIGANWQPNFIIVAPQDKYWSPGSQDIDSTIEYFSRMFRADTSAVFVTGLSAGGATSWNYVAHLGWSPSTLIQAPSFHVKAAVVMSMAGQAGYGEGERIAADGVHVWGFGGNQDGMGQWTKNGIDSINKYRPGLARFTWYNGGHCCWNNFYDPNYKENINGKMMSIYDWMLSFAVSSPAPQPNPQPNPQPTPTYPILLKQFIIKVLKTDSTHFGIQVDTTNSQ